MKVKLEGIYKSYFHKRLEHCVLNDFSHTFESGRLYVIKGESGRGKTTLLSIIGLLQRPDRGSIYFDDRTVADLPERNRAQIRSDKVGIIFQDYNLFNELSVIDNVILAEVCTNKSSIKAAKMQAEKYLELLGLKGRENAPAKFLSGGEQQRTSIARALMKNAELLICDEPVSNLDENNTNHIVGFMDSFCHKDKKIAVISSHDKAFDDIADEIIEL